MNTVIDYGRYDVTVRVLKPEAEVGTTATAEAKGADVWRDFMAAGRAVKAPARPPSPEDLRHCRLLLRKYDAAQLKEFSRVFWLKHSQPIFENPDQPVMRLFVGRIPYIEKEI